ncbi:galactitol-1-phosphate 5-dehydrogenase [Streptococcus suis]|nr:galactitol-1-phosphate 5-dehydrogenase [Streptococcus suis]
MKALVLVENNKIEVQDLPKPSLVADGDVLVKVAYTGICGSDYVRFFENQAKYYPIILTHEFSGVVEESKSADFKPGDKVAIIPLKPDFDDEQSKKGNYSLSETYSFIGSREDGGLRDYAVIPAENLVKIPDEIDLRTAAFIEPLTVNLHGFKVAELDKLDIKKVALIGMGTIGLLALQILVSYGYDVTAFDISEDKLRLSRELGATATVNTLNAEELEAAYNQFDFVCETSGANQSYYIVNKLAVKKGNILYIGTPHKDLTIDFQTFELINRKELTARGSWMNYSAPWPGEEWTEAVELFRKGAIQIDPLIAADVTIDTFDTIFDDYRNRKIDGKIFVTVNGEN